jgi:hypothetical protein
MHLRPFRRLTSSLTSTTTRANDEVSTEFLVTHSRILVDDLQ